MQSSHSVSAGSCVIDIDGSIAYNYNMRRREPHDLLAFIAGMCLFFAFDEGKSTPPNYLLLFVAAVFFVFWAKLEAKSAVQEQNPWRVIFTVMALIAAILFFCCSF